MSQNFTYAEFTQKVKNKLERKLNCLVGETLGLEKRADIHRLIDEALQEVLADIPDDEKPNGR